jgi:hypothetical protein
MGVRKLSGAERCEPTCLMCREILALSPSTRGTEVPRRILSVDEVLTFRGLYRGILEGTHAATLEGVRARYELRREVRCSYKGGHRHRYGYVIRLLCGFTINTGRDCARNTVANFFELDGEIQRLDTREAHLLELRQIEDVKARVEQSMRATEALAGVFRNLCGDRFHGIGQRLGQAHRFHVQGLEILRPPSTLVVHTRLRELVAAVGADRAPSDETLAVQVKELKAVGALAADHERWCASARTFFGTHNLETVIELTDLALPRFGLSVKDGRLIAQRADGRWELGVDGMKQVRV